MRVGWLVATQRRRHGRSMRRRDWGVARRQIVLGGVGQQGNLDLEQLVGAQVGGADAVLEP